MLGALNASGRSICGPVERSSSRAQITNNQQPKAGSLLLGEADCTGMNKLQSALPRTPPLYSLCSKAKCIIVSNFGAILFWVQVLPSASLYWTSRLRLRVPLRFGSERHFASPNHFCFVRMLMPLEQMNKSSRLLRWASILCTVSLYKCVPSPRLSPSLTWTKNCVCKRELKTFRNGMCMLSVRALTHFCVNLWNTHKW